MSDEDNVIHSITKEQAEELEKTESESVSAVPVDQYLKD